MKSLMDLIDKTYMSSDEDERVVEIEQIKNDNSYALMGWHILYTLRRTPFVDSNNIIDDNRKVRANNNINSII